MAAVPHMGIDGSSEFEEDWFRFKVVRDILEGRLDEALKNLSSRYRVSKPKLNVGRVKGRSGSAGCYVPRKKTIYAATSNELRDPRVILHEFYHHLRSSQEGKSRGAEKYADKFAMEFIQAYLRIVRGLFREEVGEG